MNRKYGVKMTLGNDNPLSAEHLLGNDFSAERWFSTEQERAHFLKSYQTPFIYFRKSDTTTFNYELLQK